MLRILVVLAIVIIGIIVIWFGFVAIQSKNHGTVAGQLEVSSSLVDFGDIDQNGGIVSATVEVSNTGLGTLEIHRVSTSCGCTTATMDTSPIAPGEQRTLDITFDPMAHPDQIGKISRVVYIQSSDPDMPEMEIDVVGDVIPITDL